MIVEKELVPIQYQQLDYSKLDENGIMLVRLLVLVRIASKAKITDKTENDKWHDNILLNR